LEGLYRRIAGDFRRGAEERERSYCAARERLIRGLRIIATEAAEAAALARNSRRHSERRPERSSELRSEQAAGRTAEEDAEEGRILQRLDRTLRAINDSEVKEVAGFLFPSPEEFDPAQGGQHGGTTGQNGEGSPFTRYVETAGRIYEALAEAAEYQLTVLEARSKPKMQSS
jgi:hypothetical protein